MSEPAVGFEPTGICLEGRRAWPLHYAGRCSGRIR